MAEHSPVDVVRHASTWSIIWGVLLIVFGMFAVGSPLIAAVAVNAVIAWLIILAGLLTPVLVTRKSSSSAFLRIGPNVGGYDDVLRLIGRSDVKCHDDHLLMPSQRVVHQLLGKNSGRWALWFGRNCLGL